MDYKECCAALSGAGPRSGTIGAFVDTGAGSLDDCPVLITFTRRRHVDLRRVASQACRR
ncbi:putative leader peptide [Saccharopolyspora shandongensis]|uniref:putative leader peptide n=1 Tax=Saccharopolyspora shandongensis TaxID=418495 RepID=UPI0033EB167D